MPLHGERLAKPSYSILRSIRGGTTGETVLARHEVFGREVVQKTYSYLGLEDAIATREPRLMQTIRHAHIAAVLEAQFDPDFDYSITFVMPYYEGGSVADALAEGYAFSTHQAITLTRQTLDALAHLHTVHEYIHRDAKPGNVFLDEPRRSAYLGDFGSVAEMGSSGRASAVHGTPLYTPPEGGPDDGEMGVSGDIYSVGLMLFEMLNGPFPYAGISPEMVERRLAAARRALPDSEFETWDPCVPSALRTVVRTAIRRSADDRYQSASDFIAALGRVRCVDWSRAEGSGLDGTWRGTWPPHEREGRRRTYEVTSRVLRGGTRRRLQAVEAMPRRSSSRRFGVEDATVAPNDRTAVERFFAEVSTRAAQRAAAR